MAQTNSHSWKHDNPYPRIVRHLADDDPQQTSRQSKLRGHVPDWTAQDVKIIQAQIDYFDLVHSDKWFANEVREVSSKMEHLRRQLLQLLVIRSMTDDDREVLVKKKEYVEEEVAMKLSSACIARAYNEAMKHGRDPSSEDKKIGKSKELLSDFLIKQLQESAKSGTMTDELRKAINKA